MIPPFLDRESIEIRKASFQIERYADPEIEPMPEVRHVRVGNRLIESKRQLASDLSRTLDHPRSRDKRKGRTPANKITAMTGRAIIDQLRAGRSMAQIAVLFHASRSAISKALRREMLQHHELEIEHSAMLVCGCGRAKLPHRKWCIRCRQGRTDCEPISTWKSVAG